MGFVNRVVPYKIYCDHFLPPRKGLIAEAGSGWLIKCRDGWLGMFLPEAESCFPVLCALGTHEGGRGIRWGESGSAGGRVGHVLGAQVVHVAERHHEEDEGDADQPGIDVPFVGQASADSEPDLVGGTGGPIETSRILCCHGAYSAMPDAPMSRRGHGLNK